MRRISENGLLFAAAWETFSPVAYRATKAEKHLTIGYGHYGPDVREGQRISKEDALTLLWVDMDKCERAVDAVAHRSLTQAQFDAVVDLCFNAGTGVIGATTGTGQALRNGNVELLRAKLSQFIYQAGKPLLGLKRRTTGRIALFDGDVWQVAERKGREVAKL